MSEGYPITLYEEDQGRVDETEDGALILYWKGSEVAEFETVIAAIRYMNMEFMPDPTE